MDPLSALAIATSAAQFLDFGYSIITGTAELYQSSTGLTEQNLNIATLSARVRKLASLVDTAAKRPAISPLVSPHDAQLRQITKDCTAISNQLLEIIDELRLKEKHTVAASIIATIRAKQREPKIRGLHRRLVSGRSELTAILVALVQYDGFPPCFCVTRANPSVDSQ